MVPLLTGVLTALAYIPSLGNAFVAFDDDLNFLRNESYRGLGGANLRWMFTEFHGGHYQPLSWLTLGLDYVVWGMNPFGYHLTNVILHAFAAVAFALLAGKMFSAARKGWGDDHPVDVSDPSGSGAAVWFGGLVALAWSLHPLRVEAVTWITERREVLCGLLTILALGAHFRHRPRWQTVVLATCAMFAKATAVTIPVLLVLIDVSRGTAPGREGVLRAAWSAVRRHALLFVLAVVIAVVAVAAQREAKALVSYEMLPFSRRIVLYFANVCFCVWKSVWPAGLAPIHRGTIGSTWDLQSVVWWQAAAGLLLAVAAVTTAWRRRSQGLGALALAVAFLVTVAPASGLGQSGAQTAADRYTYQSSWVLTVAVGLGLAARSRWPERWWASFATTVPTVLVLGLLAAGSVSQQRCWHDTEALLRRELDVYPLNAVANYRLGLLYLERRPPDLAASEACLRTAVAAAPDDPDAPCALADLLISSNRSADAVEMLLRVLRRHPDHVMALALSGKALGALGRKPEAVAAFEKLLSVDAGNPESYWLVGRAQAATGRPRDAIATFESGIARIPDPMLFSELSWLLATHPNASVRDGRRALDLARQALSGTRDARTIVVFAAACAEVGAYDQAQREVEAAIPGMPDQQDALRDLLQQIGRRQPFRVEPQFPVVGISSAAAATRPSTVEVR